MPAIPCSVCAEAKHFSLKHAERPSARVSTIPRPGCRAPRSAVRRRRRRRSRKAVEIETRRHTATMLEAACAALPPAGSRFSRLFSNGAAHRRQCSRTRARRHRRAMGCLRSTPTAASILHDYRRQARCDARVDAQAALLQARHFPHQGDTSTSNVEALFSRAAGRVICTTAPSANIELLLEVPVVSLGISPARPRRAPPCHAMYAARATACTPCTPKRR